MIRVGVNGRALGKSTPAGVSQYAGNLLRALAQRSASGDSDLSLVVFGVDELPDGLAAFDCVRDANVAPPTPSGPRAHLWEQFRLPRAVERRDLDLFHTPAGQPPLLARVPQVTTVHDVSPVTHPEWFSTSYSVLTRAFTPLAVRRSTRVITVSEFSREELVATYPAAAGETRVVYNGVTEPADPGHGAGVDGLDPGFVLFVGSTNPRKNLGGLLRAYREYRQEASDPAPLVVAGPDRDVFATREYPHPDGVRALGYVPGETLGWLYRNAGAFAYPSRYEGFGLPVLEAMSVGTPVVTADRGATSEVAGDAARLVDPGDPSSIAAGIEDVADGAPTLAERGRERAAQFTWDRAAERTAAVYEDVVGAE